MALFRSAAATSKMLANGSAVPQASKYLMAAACYSSSKLAAAAAGNQSNDPLGINQKEGRVEGAFDNERHEGDTYYATSSYPDTTPDQAKPAAASSSSNADHPHGPADVSSVNDPAGKGKEPEGNEHVHYPGRPDAQPGGSSSSNASGDSFKAQAPSRTSMETFPGTSFEQGMTQPSGFKGSRGFSSSSGVVRTFETLTRKFKMSLFADDSSSSSSMMGRPNEVCCGHGIAAAVREYASGRNDQGGGISQGSFAGEGAGGDSSEIPVPSHSWSDDQNSKKDPESAEATLNTVEGGTGSPVSGAWRAMTADFAAGGDDMTGGGAAGTVADDMGMKVNSDTGLPQLNDVNDAGAHSAGFGAQRDPQAASDEAYTARQTEKSTGQMPANAGSS